MEYLALIGTICLVHVISVMSPGPDFVLCVRNSMVYGRKTGIYTAFGLSIGILVHILYCAFGLALIISKSIILFNIIKLFGAAYLIYIGYKSLIAKKSTIQIDTSLQTPLSPFSAFKIGFLGNVLNPKATVYFLSLFTFVISPDVPLIILVIISALMVCIMFVWFSLVALFFTHEKVLKVFKRGEKYFNRLFGFLLVLLGIKVATSSVS